MSNPDGVGVEVGLGKAVVLCLHDARGAQAQVLLLGVWVGVSYARFGLGSEAPDAQPGRLRKLSWWL